MDVELRNVDGSLNDNGYYLYRKVFGSEEGKLVLEDLLHELDYFSTSGEPGAIGARRVGVWLMRAIAHGNDRGSTRALVLSMIERSLDLQAPIIEGESDD